MREVLKKHSSGMVVVKDSAVDYTLASPTIGPNKKPMWCGCVLLKKSAVTYHLMPLYFNPKLEEAIPPELLARKQGKTCFNFQRPDEQLFAKLDALTAMGREQWERRGFLTPGTISMEQMEEAVRAGGIDTAALARERKAKGKAAAAKRAVTLKKKADATAKRRAGA